MTRYLLAVIAFCGYSFTLIYAFKISAIIIFGEESVPKFYATGDPNESRIHFFWQVLSEVAVTTIAAFISGAFAKTNGGRVAAIACIINILGGIGVLLAIMLRFGFEYNHGLWMAKLDIESVWLIVFILISIWISFLAGNAGAAIQKTAFTADCVLGLRPLHFLWFPIPLFIYSSDIITTSAKFISIQYATWNNFGITTSLIFPLTIAPIFALVLPLKIAHGVLTGHFLVEKSSTIKGLATAGTLFGGYLIATGIRIACQWGLQKL